MGGPVDRSRDDGLKYVGARDCGDAREASASDLGQPIDLELCVAHAITEVGGAILISINDRDRRALMLGCGHTPWLPSAVKIHPSR